MEPVTRFRRAATLPDGVAIMTILRTTLAATLVLAARAANGVGRSVEWYEASSLLVELGINLCCSLEYSSRTKLAPVGSNSIQLVLIDTGLIPLGSEVTRQGLRSDVRIVVRRVAGTAEKGCAYGCSGMNRVIEWCRRSRRTKLGQVECIQPYRRCTLALPSCVAQRRVGSLVRSADDEDAQ
jgi:hypothetical protein